ncbi:hypothetical protein [Pseudoxanthomonas mexicana]|uniref:hypothetical protein n=1 Tax=Pseudoxanthomonas mexicana TaxID=128785 RepID=UPI0007825CB2|nr:hypothetical protein [Pseudoxanthomonas mexicana]
MKRVDRSRHTLIVVVASVVLLRGLYIAEQCYRAGNWVVEIKGVSYTGGLAMFIVGAMIVFGAGFVITSLRALSKPS